MSDLGDLEVVPEALASAAKQLDDIGSTLSASNQTAAAPITSGLAAGADDVSAAAAEVLEGHAQDYQALSAQISAFHQQFVQALLSSATSYAGTEAANATPLQAPK
jgi:hypothetical protein